MYYRPIARWIKQGDSASLMWGHIKVGEVTLGAGGWYAYYIEHDARDRMKSLGDFPAFDLAQREVERALERVAESR